MMIEKHTIALIQKVGVMSTHPERYFDIPRDTLYHGEMLLGYGYALSLILWSGRSYIFVDQNR